MTFASLSRGYFCVAAHYIFSFTCLRVFAVAHRADLYRRHYRNATSSRRLTCYILNAAS